MITLSTKYTPTKAVQTNLRTAHFITHDTESGHDISLVQYIDIKFNVVMKNKVTTIPTFCITLCTIEKDDVLNGEKEVPLFDITKRDYLAPMYGNVPINYPNINIDSYTDSS